MNVKMMPDNMESFEVDLTSPNKALISGLYQEFAQFNGKSRSFLTYIPENQEYCRPCLVVTVPSAEKPSEYLETSGLKTFADNEQLYLHLVTPEGNTWCQDGTDADFVNTIYSAIQSRDYYVTMQDNIYLCGIGDSAFISHQAAKRMASEWSGLISVGNLTSDLKKDAPVVFGERDQGDLELKIQGSAAQLPVWMLVKEDTADNQNAVDYWKEQNHTAGVPLSGDGSDYIWMPSPVHKTNEINNESIAQVRLTISADPFSVNQLESAWNYIKLARRHRGQGSKCLRNYKDPIACGAVKKTINVDGIDRIWYEYVPSGCTSGQKLPLVVVMHGRGGSAETFFDMSGMSVVADERKFIAVFPQASFHQQKKNGLRNVLLWCGSYNGSPIDDVKFIREMVSNIEERLPVDHSRIYACGQSSGGMMSDLLSYCASDLFAACAPWSGLRSPGRMCCDFAESKPLTPTMWLYGDSDFLCAGHGEDPDFPFCLNPEMRKIFAEKLKRCKLDPENMQTWTTEPITWYSFPNKQGIPLMVIGKVNNMVHANYPEESLISYDQFLSQFSRGENGALYYRGQKVSE